MEARDPKRPVLTDLLGSGSIEHDADVVLLLHRESHYLDQAKPTEGTYEFQRWLDRMQLTHGIAEVLIPKHRHGPIGTVSLAFDERVARFSDRAVPSTP